LRFWRGSFGHKTGEIAENDQDEIIAGMAVETMIRHRHMTRRRINPK
jgi:hypothetical protein